MAISATLPRTLNPAYDLTNLGGGIFAPGGISRPLNSPLPSSPVDGTFSGHESEFFKSAIARLDAASIEEKASFRWAYARATLQTAYNSQFADDANKNAPRENLDSTDAVVKVIAAAIEKQKSDLEKAGNQQSALNPSDRYLSLQSFDDLKQQSWFSGFAGQLDAALQSRATTGSNRISKYA